MLKRPADRAEQLLGRRGVVSIEFGVIAPVLVLMILGTYDVAHGLLAWQKTVLAADQIAVAAQLLAQNTAASNTSTSLTVTQAQQAMSAVYAAVPELRTAGYPTQYSVTLSSVQFTQVGTTYTPYLAWSATLSEGGSTTGNPRRQTHSRIGVSGGGCGVALTQTNTVPNDISTLTSVPTAMVTAPATVVIADVYFQYRPLFLKFVAGNIDFWATGFQVGLAGANAQPINYDIATYPTPATSDSATVCTGYQ